MGETAIRTNPDFEFGKSLMFHRAYERDEALAIAPKPRHANTNVLRADLGPPSWSFNEHI